MGNIGVNIATQFICGAFNLSYGPSPAPTAGAPGYHNNPLPMGNQSTEFINGTGVATLPDGHTITNGDTVDVYWTVGGVLTKRLGCSAAVVGNAVTLTGGAGTALPTDHTVLVISTQVVLADVNFAVADAVALGVKCDQACSVQFQQSDDASLLTVVLPGANGGYAWPTTSGQATPFDAGTVAKAVVSNATTVAATLEFAIPTST